LIEAAGAREAYFVPSGTTLNTQLVIFSAQAPHGLCWSTNTAIFRGS